MHTFRRLCVFCGSRTGTNHAHVEAAEKLGKLFLKENIGLVFGGGQIGLMGVISNTILKGGGEAIGVIPSGLAKKEVAHEQVSELHVVNSMHERKATMAGLTDGFIAMPGGLGTLEEIAEVLTWSQLGIHQKPCGLLNVDGFYDAFLDFLDHATGNGFLHTEQRQLIISEEAPEALLKRMKAYEPPAQTRWLTKREI